MCNERVKVLSGVLTVEQYRDNIAVMIQDKTMTNRFESLDPYTQDLVRACTKRLITKMSANQAISLDELVTEFAITGYPDIAQKHFRDSLKVFISSSPEL